MLVCFHSFIITIQEPGKKATLDKIAAYFIYIYTCEQLLKIFGNGFVDWEKI